MHGFLTESVRIDRVATAQTVDTTDVTSAAVDMAAAEAFNSVAFAVEFGAITDGTPTIKLQQSDDDGDDDAYSDLEGTSVAGAITDDNKILVVDVKRPRKRYLKAVVGRGGATGAVVDSILAILYDPKKEPVTQSPDVAAVEKHVSPAEGTA